MPKPTHIVHRRTRRRRTHQRSGLTLLRWLGLALALLLLALGTLATVGVLGATAVAATLSRDLPPFDALVQTTEAAAADSRPTQIYARPTAPDAAQADPVLIHEIVDPLAGAPRWQPLDTLPQSLIDATVAGTDPDFWSERTLRDELRGLVAAPTAPPPLTHHLIAAQLLEGAPPASGEALTLRDLRHRIERLLLSRQLENAYTKSQLLEWYLNSSYYGNLAIGIKAAAQVYFDKPAAQLNLAEAALLATLPQAPTQNPADQFAAAQARQARVLDAMVQQEMITPETAVSTRMLPVTVAPPIATRFDIIAPHFALAVQQELVQRFGPERLLRGGLQVTTGLDLSLQQQAECVARAQVNRLSGQLGPALPADERARCPALTYLPTDGRSGTDRDVRNAAVVMLDPATGVVRALVGSRNYWDDAIDGATNAATDAVRQPGSALHPLIYLTALSQGYTPATMLLDVPTDFGDVVSFTPQNADGDFHGPLRLREALGSGYRVPAVQALSWVGVNKVVATAHSLGVNGLIRGDYDLSLPLDGGDVTLLDLAYAYAVMGTAA